MPEPRPNAEILCQTCGRNALARPEPVYDGFRKVGEAFVCTACGHRYASRETTPFIRGAKAPRVFTDQDRPVAPKVFADTERRRSCGWCAHRVVNPFGQRCGLTNREIESTDLCDRFEARAESEGETAPPRPAPDALSRLFGD